MDVEAWIICHLEPIAPDAPDAVSFDGPAGIIVRVEVDWFEGDSGSDAPCRGVDVAVSGAGEPASSFAYTLAESGRSELVDRLEPKAAERVSAAIGSDAW